MVRGFQRVGVSEDMCQKKIIAVASKLPENSVYHELHDVCIERYNTDPEFKQNCMLATAVVLDKYVSNVTQSALEIAVNYFLGELPFYMDTPRMLNVDSSVVVYHKPISFFVDLFKDRQLNSIANNQGHIVLEL